MGTFDFVGYNERLQGEISGALQGSGDDLLSRVISDVIDQAETLLAETLTAFDHAMLACRAGCGHCCVVNVSVLVPEAINISNYLHQTRSEEELSQLNKKMHKLVTAISELDNDERVALRASCVFLDDQGLCSIYPVRPLLCRAVTSISVDDCRNALDMRKLGQIMPVTMNLFQKELFDTSFQALATSLEQAGLDACGYELTAAVLHQLGLPGHTG
jgi:Fe-S-cluster containining protein